MARNYEKRFSALNRFVEAKQKQEGKGEKKRPSLHQLATAEDVKQWIPSIKKDIDYCLQQISHAHPSRNYSDRQIQEFKDRIDRLKHEHQRFVAKVRQLDESYRDVVPWEPRAYHRKRPSGSSHMSTKRSCDHHVTLVGKELESCTTNQGRAMSHDSHVKSKDNHVISLDSRLDQACSKQQPSHDCHMTLHDTSSNPLNLNYSSSSDSELDDGVGHGKRKKIS